MTARVPDELPPRIYRKVGKKRDTYWTIHRRRYVYLGDSLEAALQNLDALDGNVLSVKHWAWELVTRCRKRARRLGVECTLTGEWIAWKIREQGMRCAVTGRMFTAERTEGQRIRMHSPSVDRLDNARGYTPDNVRIVCAFANIAMNRFGEKALRRFARDVRTSKNSNIRS